MRSVRISHARHRAIMVRGNSGLTALSIRRAFGCQVTEGASATALGQSSADCGCHVRFLQSNSGCHRRRSGIGPQAERETRSEGHACQGGRSMECYLVFWPVVCAGGFDVVCWSRVLAAHTITATTTSTAMTAEAIVPVFQGPSTF
jgi:hypothetical protein